MPIFFAVQRAVAGISCIRPRGADVRARVHDEARLLADQAVDERRVEADLLRPGRDFLAQRHREALVHVDLGAGAVAGVDAAVPDLAVAGELRGGQQLAVAQAADREVPFAHAFVAQADRDQRQRAGQAGMGGAASRSAGVSGAGLRRQRLRLAEVFGGELAVEVELPGDAGQQLAGCSSSAPRRPANPWPAPAGRAPSSRPRPGPSARPALIASIACTTCCQRGLPPSARSAARTFQASMSSGSSSSLALAVDELGALELVGRLRAAASSRSAGRRWPRPRRRGRAAAPSPSGRPACRRRIRCRSRRGG